MRDKLKAAVMIGCLLGLIVLCHNAGERIRKAIPDGKETAVSVSGAGAVVVLDAGHGGIDAGKIGVNGAEEKSINLEISLKIKNLLNKSGISVVMTRNDDNRLGNTQRNDLQERVRIMNEEHPLLAVSIHQNSYESADVRGPQIFYHTNSDEGRSAAEILQEELNQLDPQYAREEKGDNSYYILKNAEVPVVIVECGFLSNREEAEKLISEDYQEEVAEAVADGIKKYID